MTDMKRFAVYYAPPPGGFADRANRWLGRDPATGQTLAPPDPGVSDPGLDAAAITTDPRRYGFHGTIKPPFRLAEGIGRADLDAALTGLAGRLAPVTLAGLRIAVLDGFVALIPEGDSAPLHGLAATVVRDLDRLRAPLTAPEIARRRPERLTRRQRELLDQWGYPFVFEEFRFHLTLTGRLPADQADRVSRVLGAHFAPVLPRPFVIGDLCLFGEPADGQFRLIHRYALTG